MIFQLPYKMSNHWWCLTVATTNTNDGIQSNTTVHALHWIHFWWCNTVIAIIMNQIFPFHIKKQTCARGYCMIEKCYFLSEALQNSGKNTKYFHLVKRIPTDLGSLIGDFDCRYSTVKKSRNGPASLILREINSGGF